MKAAQKSATQAREHEQMLAKKQAELQALIERRAEDIKRVEDTFKSIVEEKERKLREVQAKWDEERVRAADTARDLRQRERDLQVLQCEFDNAREKCATLQTQGQSLAAQKSALAQQLSKNQNETAVLVERLNRANKDFETRLGAEMSERERT